MANLMLDLNYYETASYYYQKSIDEYNEITKYRKTGLNSFLPDILRQYARCLIDKGNIVDGLINLEKASNEYDKIIIQDNEYLESFVDTMIEYYYVTENNKNIEGFSPEEIEDLYNELAKRIKTKEECYTYFIFICIEMIFIYQRAGRIVESEKYIIELYHMLDRNNQKSNFSQSVFTFIGFSLDEIAQEKYSKRMLKDSILLSRMALEFINATEHLQKNVLQITQIIQRCANYHDEVGLKEEALNYYNQALKELEELEDSNHHVVLRKASILYDYGVAVTPLDFDRAEKILRNSIDLYQHFHDGKGQVAIQYADAEQALANILDDTERFHEAEKHYKSSVHVLSSISNEPLASERLRIALNNYGIMLMKQHRISEAKKTLRHSREIRLNSDPYGVIRTDDSLYRLALYEEKDEEAYIYLKEILEIQEKYGVILCGLLNEFTNYTDTFVQICIKINKINEAKLAYKKVYDMICNIPEDDMTDEMQGNKCIVRDRIYDIFKTVDFLTN